MLTIEGQAFMLWMMAHQALLPMAVKNWNLCQSEADADWLAYCGILNSQGFAMDCENANKAEVKAIKWRLAWQQSTRQYKCLFG